MTKRRPSPEDDGDLPSRVLAALQVQSQRQRARRRCVTVLAGGGVVAAAHKGVRGIGRWLEAVPRRARGGPAGPRLAGLLRLAARARRARGRHGHPDPLGRSSTADSGVGGTGVSPFAFTCARRARTFFPRASTRPFPTGSLPSPAAPRAGRRRRSRSHTKTIAPLRSARTSVMGKERQRRARVRESLSQCGCRRFESCRGTRKHQAEPSRPADGRAPACAGRIEGRRGPPDPSICRGARAACRKVRRARRCGGSTLPAWPTQRPRTSACPAGPRTSSPTPAATTATGSVHAVPGRWSTSARRSRRPGGGTPPPGASSPCCCTRACASTRAAAAARLPPPHSRRGARADGSRPGHQRTVRPGTGPSRPALTAPSEGRFATPPKRPCRCSPGNGPWGNGPSAGRVAAVGEEGLAGDPPAVGGQEGHQRHDVLDLGEVVAQRLRLVELHALRVSWP